MNANRILSYVDFKINNYKSLSILIILLLIAVLINLGARVYEKNIWQENPGVFSAEGEPLIRTGDPAYFLNMAMYLKKGIPISEYKKKLFFNDGYAVYDNNAPLLSHLISFLSKGPSITELVNTGNKIILIASIITTIGIFFMFFSIGRPFEGIVASLGAGISANYFHRSSFGYIDTDILNLFFMYFLFAMIYLASRKQSWIKTTLFIIIAGIIGKIFYSWYPKPELILISFLSLFYFTTINTKKLEKIIFCCLIYILITGPLIYLDSFSTFLDNPYLSGYLSAGIQSSDLTNKSSLNFNNIFRFIGEQQQFSVLYQITVDDSIYLGIACLIGILLWGIKYPLMFIGFTPLIFFFLLSGIIGNRALFYSLPFMWFGLGYLINFLIFKFTKYREIYINKNTLYTLSSLFLIAFATLYTNAFTKNISPPYISSLVIDGLIKMNDIVDDKDNSVIVAPWSYGYQSLLYNDIPVIIHNGQPTSARHYFLARAFTSTDLNETKKILNYMVNGNVEKIKSKGIDSFTSLSKDLYQSAEADRDIYFFLMQKHRLSMNSEAATAYWDIEKNKPYLFEGKTAYEVFHISEINCDDLDTTKFTTKCADEEGGTEKNIPVNLALGTINDIPVLKRVVQIADGKVEINQEYENSKGNMVFQIVKNLEDNTSNLYLMHEAVFRSTYNKLLHLNQSENFELVYDDYPNMKVYKLIN